MNEGPLWRISLFGGPAVSGPDRTLHRFRSAKVASLLAYLAIHHEKACSREAIIEALWPEELDREAARNRFRVALSSLRKQLEPSDAPAGSVLDTSIQGCISLRKGATTCDLADFEVQYKSKNFQEARRIFCAPLLPGMYDEWLSPHQIRFALLEEELEPYTFVEARQSPAQARSAMSRLPHYLTAYFGREADLKVLLQLLQSHRLVTILGIGGMGKSRLAIETARGLTTPVAFVSLIECTTEAEITETIIRNISDSAQNLGDSYTQLVSEVEKLDERVIILDNAEHISDSASKIIETILGANEKVRVLVTSRQPLEILGEQCLPLGPLDNAARLFVDRARLSRPDFSPNQQALADIDRICVAVGSLPLAVELAAAQVAHRAIPEILAGLSATLTPLKSRQRTLNPRHQSLRSTVEGSLNLIPDAAKKLLGQISVFRGPFTFEQANLFSPKADIQDEIGALVRASLLTAETLHVPTRYRCHEVIRQFAAETLSPTQAEDLARKHARYFNKLASGVDDTNLATLIPLDQFSENFDAALAHADRTTEYWSASRGMIMHAFIRGNHRDAMRWIHQGDLQGPPDWLFACLQVLPDLGLYDKAKRHIQKLREHGGELANCQADIIEGLVLARSGEIQEAERLHRQALQTANTVGSKNMLSLAVAHLSGTLHQLGKEEGDKAALTEAYDLAASQIPSVKPSSRLHPLIRLLAGVPAYYLGDYPRAKTHLHSAIRSAQTLQIASVIMYAKYFLAQIAREQGDNEEAVVLEQEFTELQNRIGIRWQ